VLDNTDEIIYDLRIREIRALNTPAEILREMPHTDTSSRTISRVCLALQGIVQGGDGGLAVIIGPCSIHDPEAAMDYAARLAARVTALAATWKSSCVCISKNRAPPWGGRG
jgi:3-deoxy-7-phosphoheptulonate synthase